MIINQFLPTLSSKDAIGNEALIIQALLKKWGHSSHIYGENCEPGIKSHFKHISKHKHSDLSIYHHSIGCSTADFITKLSGEKIMLYHNITPEEYFWGTNLELATLSSIGRKQLQQLKPHFDLALADSEYNRLELEKIGYKNTKVLPLLIDFSTYKKVNNSKTFGSNDKQTLLFVGKIAPHKNQYELIKVFYYYNKYINSNSQLFIVGNSTGFESYFAKIKNLINSLELDNVYVTGPIDQAKLNSLYKNADAFVCLSKHEGFCVPLIESMHFELPVIALDRTAVAWTLGGSGILFNTNDSLEIAELINYSLTNKSLIKKVIELQNKRLDSFKLEKTTAELKSIITSMI